MFTEQLSLVGPKDVVVAVSFSPYAREVVELVELGAQRKARQIAITDSRQPAGGLQRCLLCGA